MSALTLLLVAIGVAVLACVGWLAWVWSREG